MDVATWQNRLNLTFLSGGTPHLALRSVFEAEQEHAFETQKRLNGHISLLNSFQVFLLETFIAMGDISNSQGSPTYRAYGILQFEFTMAFRTIRVCEQLLMTGYPLTGYGLLRGLKERTWFICAVGRGETSFERLLGLKPNMTSAELADDNEIRKRKKAEEKQILDLIMRKADDLGPHRAVLQRWERRFNVEVHGDLYSGAHLITKWVSGGGPPFLPEFEEDQAAMYLNCMSQLSWMLLRLLPLLQRLPGAFGSRWAERWQILDESFEFMNRDSRTLNKPLLAETSHAIEFFLQARFSFSPSTSCYDSCLE